MAVAQADSATSIAKPERVRDRAHLVTLAVGLACTALYAANLSESVNGPAFLLVALGCPVALALGPRLHRAEPADPWRWMAVATALLATGALVRPWAAGRTGLTMAAADAFSMPGYALLLVGFVRLIKARGGFERHSVADGLIVSVAAGIASVTLFSLPAARVLDRPALVSALAGVYPILDTALVLVLVNLAFTTAVRRPSFRYLTIAVGLLMIGDLGYAIIGATGRLSGPRWLDLPYSLMYAFLAAAALHPSMVQVGQALPRPVQAWSARRLALLVPALAVPFVLAVTLAPTPVNLAVVASGGAVMVGLLLVRAASAVSAYARTQEVFRYQATHDGLTGLPNRMALTAAVGRMLPGVRDRDLLWLSFLDIDGFKLVNDTWGHEAGDKILTEVGRRLRLAAPPGAVVARLGGDEFVVAEVAGAGDAPVLAERLTAALRAPLTAGGIDVVVSASIGLAAGGRDTTAERLMREADTAMYRAKAEGRDRWLVFDASMHRNVRERMETEMALRRALDAGELQVAFQPIVKAGTGRVAGAEALVRWNDAVRGPVPPTTFIPIAEDAGLIGQLGEFVLGVAMLRTAQWRNAGVVPDDFWMSVNVSSRQLRDDGMLGLVRRTLAETGLPPSALVLEITESVMLDQSEVTERVLQDLRALGVRLSVDDFGTGFSALGYLRRHPVTGVKIDRSFVDGLGRDAEDEEIVRAIVAMSSALGLSVVAEGVETEAQRDVLISLGVGLGQGWLWGKAMEPDAFVSAARTLGAPASLDQVLAGNSYAQ